MNRSEIIENSVINEGNIARFHAAFKKAEAKEPMTIGFIGGSITQGALSSTIETCYAYLVLKWWQEKFPLTSFTYVNAGIGATTSQFGVARVESDLLSYEPDVVFLEFSVNDSLELKYFETFEGIVRKILTYKKQPALFMFNNVCYDTGMNAQAIHNRIGKHYDLPIVSMKSSIYKAMLDGTYQTKELTLDNLHPNDKGHRLIADLLIHLLEQINEKAKTVKEVFQPFLPQPISPNRYYHSMRYNQKNSNPKLDGFVPDLSTQVHVSDVFKNGWTASCIGDCITFEVTGTMIAIQYRRTINKPAPVAEVMIDGEVVLTLDANFNETWGDCLSLQDVLIAGEDTLHTVTVRIIKAENIKSDFYLASIITA